MSDKEIKYATVIFIRGNSFIPRLIEDFDGEFSHVALSITDTGSHVIESQGMSLSRIRLNPYLDSDYEVIHFNLTDDQKNELNRLAIKYCGYGYDYSRIVGFMLKKIFRIKKPNFLDEKYNFLCSELVEILLGGIGLVPIDSKFGDRTPNELYLHLKNLV